MQKARQMMHQVIYNIYMYRFDYIRMFMMFRIFPFLVIVPVSIVTMNMMLTVTGYTNLTEQNIQSFFMHPLVQAMILLFIFIVLLFLYYEIGFLLIMAFNQQRGIRYHFLTIWQQLNRKLVYFFSLLVMYLIGCMILILPFVAWILPFTLMQETMLPPVITDEIMRTRLGRVFYAASASIIIFVGVRSLLTLPIFIIHPKISIRQSFLQSWRLSKRVLLPLLAVMATLLMSYLVLFITISMISTLPLLFLERIIPSIALVTAGLTFAFLEMMFVVLFSLLQVIFSQVIVASTYNRRIFATPWGFDTYNRYTSLSIVFCVIFSILSMSNIHLLEESVYAPDTKIVAHRGYTAGNIENTMSALVGAAHAGADIVELDIQQTVDGEFVVFHDRTLRRLTGKNGVIANMMLSELKTIPIYENRLSDKISSLDDFIEMAKALDVTLLIELKVHGQEREDVLLRLVEKLRAYKVLDTYYVQSSDAQRMTQLKNLAPNLRVGIVYALDIERIDRLNVDFIALEESWVTKDLIAELQQQHIDLFVWTLNKDRSLQEFIEKNVAGVITDHPDVALDIRMRQSEQQYFLQRVFNQ